MARYYLDPEIRITGIIEDSKVGVWLTPHVGLCLPDPDVKQLFLGVVRANQELKVCVPAGLSNHGHVIIRVRKVGWLPIEFHWPPIPAEPDPEINIQQVRDGAIYA